MTNNPANPADEPTTAITTLGHRALWVTDIHLEFLKPAQIEVFFQQVAAQQPDSVLITGDITNFGQHEAHLTFMAELAKAPVYFVLGNHDYYGTSVQHVHDAMTRITRRNPTLRWLDNMRVVPLSADTALVGHGGWSDGRYGSFLKSPVILTDYIQIYDLTDITPVERFKRMCALADAGANHLRDVLAEAVPQYKRVFVLTHAPPFIEACWHEGKTPTLDDPYLPHFTCKAIGDVLLEFAERHAEHQFTVLCGHTHGGGEAYPRQNLHVITGPAEYGSPVVQRVFTIE